MFNQTDPNASLTIMTCVTGEHGLALGPSKCNKIVMYVVTTTILLKWTPTDSGIYTLNLWGPH